MSDLLLPLLVFAVATSFSPGPNTLMLAASGANYGFRRTLPHILGITLGWPFLLFAVALGLGVVFRDWPALHHVLKIVGAGYLLYLAWRIAMAGRAKAETAKPLSLLQAAAFQWVNPKAWMIAVGAAAAYITPQSGLVSQALVVTLVFAAVSVFATSTWALFGAGIGRLLGTPERLRAFNLAMGGLLAVSVVGFFL